MSQENMEIVRRFSECWERRDWDAMAQLADPSIEQHGSVGGLEEGRLLRGISEIRRDFERVETTWDEHRVEPQEIFDAGDRVVVFLREYQRGRRSGIELVVDTAVVLDLRHGRIVRIQGYMDRAEALRAVGLSAEDAPRSSPRPG
jgi:ketosteroid isomerase-like protein